MNDTHQRADLPSEETCRALLDEIAPGSVVLAIGSLPGSYSNHTHLLTARSANGSLLRLVIRRYAVFGDYDRGEKARREFKTFELLRRNDIPVPEPVYLDEKGVMLGTPGIVTRYVPGQHAVSPADPESWARSLGLMLARIHAVPCDSAARSFLLDANSEASWFLRSGCAPDYVTAHPLGDAVWQTANDLWPKIQQVPAGLVHIDYWPGNILWNKGRIAAVVDWEEAAHGDPGIDVAYCRLELILYGMSKVAGEFLTMYETEMGQRVANLAIWELAAAVRPMFNPEGWITESPARERFGQFIAEAITRADR